MSFFFFDSKYSFNSDLENEFFAVIDDISEIEEGKYELRLDAIGSKWVSDNLGENANLLQLYESITPYILFTTISKQEAEGLKYTTSLWSRKWIRLKLTNKRTDRPIQQFIDNTENPEITTRYIEGIKIPPYYHKDLIPLNSFFNWKYFRSTTKAEIQGVLLEADRGNEEVHLNVYNVGQGNLSAVCDREENPLVYYDMGGGFAWNRHTYNDTIKLFWGNTDTIIISHFDLDHLETARRAMYTGWAEFENKTWIVPKQTISPFYAKFLARIASTGTLLIWPNKVESISTPSLRVIRCFGPDKNNSGLALIVNSPDGTVMHPADAAYVHIDYDQEIHGLVATHHGANFPLNNQPVPVTQNGSIVYSYGLDNSYNHPKHHAVQAHELSQWGHSPPYRKDTTIHGHISFGLNPIPRIYCGDPNCIICSLNYF